MFTRTKSETYPAISNFEIIFAIFGCTVSNRCNSVVKIFSAFGIVIDTRFVELERLLIRLTVMRQAKKSIHVSRLLVDCIVLQHTKTRICI